MCGRARLSSDVSEIKLVFSIPPERPTPNIPANWNAAPTEDLPVVRYDAGAGQRSLDVMRWGLVPFWAKDIKVGFANINAKAEGIDTKPAFREAFARRRCLIPFDCFYEWKKLGKDREMDFRVRDGLWIRLMDVSAALAARRMGAAEPVVIEVADAFCPWNQGRWRVSETGAATTSAEADLACDVTALGSVYLGGFTFRQLASGGRVSELRPGALARADALFPSDGAPWCPEIF